MNCSVRGGAMGARRISWWIASTTLTPRWTSSPRARAEAYASSPLVGPARSAIQRDCGSPTSPTAPPTLSRARFGID